MQSDEFERSAKELLSADSTQKADRAIDELWPYGGELNAETRKLLIEYVKSGNVNDARRRLIHKLVAIASPASSDLADIFLSGLDDECLRSSAIRGAAVVVGKKIYPQLCKIALNEAYSLEDRIEAVKALSRLSKQPFFAGLMTGTQARSWSVEDLRLEEIALWQKQGYPDGSGASPPMVDAALKAPQSTLEKAAAGLEIKLARFRETDQDNYINPCNYLSAVTKGSVDRISHRYHLPQNYIEFLERFSPFNMTAYLYVPGIKPNFQFYTAENLESNQIMYTHQNGVPNSDWPSHYVAIGDAWLNPVVFDMSKSNGRDAPLLWTDHEEYPVKFMHCAPNFIAFLDKLTVTDQWRHFSDSVDESVYRFTAFDKSLGAEQVVESVLVDFVHNLSVFGKHFEKPSAIWAVVEAVPSTRAENALSIWVSEAEAKRDCDRLKKVSEGQENARDKIYTIQKLSISRPFNFKIEAGKPLIVMLQRGGGKEAKIIQVFVNEADAWNYLDKLRSVVGVSIVIVELNKIDGICLGDTLL